MIMFRIISLFWARAPKVIMLIMFARPLNDHLGYPDVGGSEARFKVAKIAKFWSFRWQPRRGYGTVSLNHRGLLAVLVILALIED